MAASVGGVSCSLVRSRVAALKTQVSVWEQPGQDGYGAHTLGAKDSAFRMLAILFDTAANVNTWVAAIQALQGTSITIVDDRGVSHTNMLLEQAAQPTIIAAWNTGIEERAEIMLTGVKLS